jgi:hypothetical protein
MADASFLQTSFLGGEWSPFSQGRATDPAYRTGLNVSRNMLPIEEGAHVRRPGARLIGPTRKGAPGVLRAFDFEESHPYNLELTANHLRFLAGAGIVVESFGSRVITALNTGNPVQITVDAAHTWATNDEVVIQIAPGEVNSTIAGLLGRQLELTSTGSTTFTVVDAVTGVPIDGTSMVLGSTDLTVTRIADFATPYQAADLQAVNTVQDQTDLILLHGSYKPYALLSTRPEQGSDFAVFNLNPAVFLDGPYLDPPTDGTTITASGLSGSVTLTLAGGSTRFAATDVGRFVRMLSEPAAWANATAYAIGDQVKFNNAYYQAIKANTGKQPDADIVNWGVATGAAQWAWAIITAVTDTTHATATLQAVPSIPGTAANAATILRTTACSVWRLGLFSDTTGYPTCGTYHEGRLFLAGVIGNRWDASVANSAFNFSPTSIDGTVADSNAVDYVFNAKDVNQIFWMEPDEKGVIAGTQAGEWLIQASSQNDPLTATSAQAHRVSNYGCANVPPKRTGITIAFVQRFTKKLLEYITTDFRGFSAHNISRDGKHLTQKGLVEIAYQSEKVPTLWARTADGALLSCTYKRESPYASDPPAFAGWSRHDLGGAQTVESIQAGPNFDGTLDALNIITSDGTHRWVQLVTDLFDVDWTIGDSLFVDFAETPSMWEVITGPPKLLRLYSLHYLAGKNVDVFAGGIDVGTLTVAADGHLDIPIDSNTLPLLTSTWLASLSSATNFHGLGLAITAVAPGVANVPTVTGIQNFDLSPLTHRNGGPSIDFDGKRLFIGDAFDGQIASYSLDTFKLLNGPVSSPNGNNGLMYAEDGYLYGWIGATNVAILKRMDASTFAELASFGVASSAMPTDATHWAYPRDVDTVFINRACYLVSTALNSSQTNGQISVLSLTNPDFAFQPITWDGQDHHTDEVLGVVCKGTPLPGRGRAWVVTQTNNLGGSISIGLYRVLISFGTSSMSKIGLIDPTTIGTGWTHATTCPGIILDETDGNIIAHFTTQDLAAWSAISTYVVGDLVKSGGHDFVSKVNANTNHSPTIGGDAFWTDLGVPGSFPTGEVRIVKINVHTGAVMWTVKTVTSVSAFQQLNQSRIRHGRYNWLDTVSPNTKQHSINTLTGVETVSGLLGALLEGGPQFTDDYTGNVYADMSFTFISSPVQIGTTPSSFSSWGTLGPAAGPAVPAAIPPSDGVVWTVPVAIGYTYTSQGQILRALAPQEAGAQNGPALGKTRRSHMFSALLSLTQGISFGADFSNMRVGQLRTAGDRPYPLTTLYSDVLQDTLEDDYSFDSMLCWQITRPYPAQVLAIEPFLHTQDR